MSNYNYQRELHIRRQAEAAEREAKASEQRLALEKDRHEAELRRDAEDRRDRMMAELDAQRAQDRADAHHEEMAAIARESADAERADRMAARADRMAEEHRGTLKKNARAGVVRLESSTPRALELLPFMASDAEISALAAAHFEESPLPAQWERADELGRDLNAAVLSVDMGIQEMELSDQRAIQREIAPAYDAMVLKWNETMRSAHARCSAELVRLRDARLAAETPRTNELRELEARLTADVARQKTEIERERQSELLQRRTQLAERQSAAMKDWEAAHGDQWRVQEARIQAEGESIRKVPSLCQKITGLDDGESAMYDMSKLLKHMSGRDTLPAYPALSFAIFGYKRGGVASWIRGFSLWLLRWSLLACSTWGVIATKGGLWAWLGFATCFVISMGCSDFFLMGAAEVPPYWHGDDDLYSEYGERYFEKYYRLSYFRRRWVPRFGLNKELQAFNAEWGGIIDLGALEKGQLKLAKGRDVPAAPKSVDPESAVTLTSIPKATPSSTKALADVVAELEALKARDSALIRDVNAWFKGLRLAGLLSEEEDTYSWGDVTQEADDNHAERVSRFEDDDPAGPDPLFEKAVDIIVTEGRGSTTLLQTKMGVGYSRATRLIEQIADAGILGPHKGSQAREVLVSQAEWEKRKVEGRG